MAAENQPDRKNLILGEETYAINGAAMEVHNALGSGFLEAVYQEALELELAARGIPFQAQQDLRICYKDQRLKHTYVADFVVYGEIIVEIKAKEQLTRHDEAQLINYLKATGLPLGLLLNFGAPKLQWKRMLHGDHRLPMPAHPE